MPEFEQRLALIFLLRKRGVIFQHVRIETKAFEYVLKDPAHLLRGGLVKTVLAVTGGRHYFQEFSEQGRHRQIALDGFVFPVVEFIAAGLRGEHLENFVRFDFLPQHQDFHKSGLLFHRQRPGFSRVLGLDQDVVDHRPDFELLEKQG